jgi:hypothetical protein
VGDMGGERAIRTNEMLMEPEIISGRERVEIKIHPDLQIAY